MLANYPEFLSKITNSRFRIIVPLLSSLSLLGITELMYSKYAIGTDVIWTGISLSQEKAPTNLSTNTNAHLLELFIWSASALSVIIIFIVTIIVCSYAIWELLTESRVKKKLIVWLGILITTGILGFISVYKTPISFFVEPLKALYPSYNGMKHIPITYCMDTLVLWESFLLIAACCMLCSPLSIHKSDQEQIIKRTQFATILFYLSAFTLAIGVLEFSFLFRLVGNVESIGLFPLQNYIVGEGLTLLAGTYCTLFIIAIFFPTLLFLTAEAYKVASIKDRFSTPEEQNLWLAQTGLVAGKGNRIIKLIAFLAPILAGWLGGPIMKVINSIAGS